MRHVVVMTGASATGLLAMFGVDMIDMYFLTLLGEQELAAAVGFAGTLLFFMVSVSMVCIFRWVPMLPAPRERIAGTWPVGIASVRCC